MARLKEYNGHYCESEYEYAFIGFLEAEGWKYSSVNNISRVTKRDVLIADDFKKFIADTNPDLTEDEVIQIYDNVRLVGAESDFATLHKVYGWMVNGVQFTTQDGLPRMIPLIDFDNWDKNIFRVVNQFIVEYTNNGQKENSRPDVLLFVNGMPLCVIELKNPADANATIYDAWEQINIRYWRDIPHLLHYCPLACISDGVKTRLGTVRTPYEHFYAWRRVNEGDAVSTLPFAETETMIKGVYAPERFMEIFRDYIYFQDSIYDSDEVEIICRYPQFFAAKLLKHIVIVVDMWITGFDVPCLTYLYNDKPLKKHLLIQTISRVNRKYPRKEYGMVIDYIGIRDNMREAMKVYGGDTSVAPTSDDVEQATSVFREELEVLKNMFTGYDLLPFLNPECDPIERYRLLAKAAEYVFVSTEELQSEGNNGVQKVSFKTYFLKTVKRMRAAFDICQPSGYLGEEESALAQCFMAIAGFVRKMSGTSEVDTDTMNRAVSKMVEEALKYNQVESVLESGEEEDIFSPEYFEKLSDVKMPATKLELLVKMLRKQIKEYGKVNRLAAKSYQEMLEKTIAEYHERRKHLTAEEAGEAQEQVSEDIIKIATEQALAILRAMDENRESFRKIGLTFEEKAFYDILISMRDQYNFEYGTDKEVDGIVINGKCKNLAIKVKEIIDTKSSFADWLNNQNVRDQLKLEIKICLVKNGYPPQYSPEVFKKVMEQVENFEEYSGETVEKGNNASAKVYQYEMFFKYPITKETEFIYGEDGDKRVIFDEMVEMLKDKIDFNILDNDIVSYFPLDLSDISAKPIKEVISGPNNRILLKDFQLLCGKYKYDDVAFRYSKISYRE